jgi:phosphoribosylanthranilate isomerase
MVRVKICGITSLRDAWMALDEGADALGFVMVPGSPRRVSAGEARSIIRTLPPFAITVGVFVDEDPRVVSEIGASCGFRFVQLHGNEPPGDAEAVGLPVIRALRVSSRADLKDAAKWRPSLFLLDSRPSGRAGKGERGGTGVPIRWERFRGLSLPAPLILAGGLEPGNVARAIRMVGPYAVDVASGVESTPGTKDRSRIRRFIRAARSARMP